MKKILFAASTLLMMACSHNENELANSEKKSSNHVAEVDSFLKSYNSEYQKYLIASAEGQWLLNTHIVEGDTVTEKMAAKADEDMAAFTGNKDIIEKTKLYLENKSELNDLQIRQLNTILFNAGANPETAGDLVKQKIAAQNKQTAALYGFKFTVNGKEVTPNDIDEVLQKSNEHKFIYMWMMFKSRPGGEVYFMLITFMMSHWFLPRVV